MSGRTELEVRRIRAADLWVSIDLRGEPKLQATAMDAGGRFEIVGFGKPARDLAEFIEQGVRADDRLRFLGVPDPRFGNRFRVVAVAREGDPHSVRLRSHRTDERSA